MFPPHTKHDELDAFDVWREFSGSAGAGFLGRDLLEVEFGLFMIRPPISNRVMIPIICTHCTKEFSISNKVFKQKTKKGQKNFFCDQKCLHSWQAKPVVYLPTNAFSNTKWCRKCEKEIEIENFGSKGKGKGLQALCKSHLYEYQIERWHAIKEKAIAYLGGSCKNCGVIDHPVIYDFHHRNGDTKEYDWSKLKLKSWNSILEELQKCDLLCVVCHRKEHCVATSWPGWRDSNSHGSS